MQINSNWTSVSKNKDIDLEILLKAEPWNDFIVYHWLITHSCTISWINLTLFQSSLEWRVAESISVHLFGKAVVKTAIKQCNNAVCCMWFNERTIIVLKVSGVSLAEYSMQERVGEAVIVLCIYKKNCPNKESVFQPLLEMFVLIMRLVSIILFFVLTIWRIIIVRFGIKWLNLNIRACKHDVRVYAKMCVYGWIDVKRVQI